MTEEKRVYTPKEAAAVLGVHPNTLYKFIKTGAIEAVKLGRSYRISAGALQKVIDKGIKEEPDTDTTA